MRVTWLKKQENQHALNCPSGFSMACTVIALVCAEKASTIPEGGAVKHDHVMPLLVESIKEGNEIHRAAKYRPNDALSVPEAIALLGSNGFRMVEKRSVYFNFNNGTALRQAIEELLADWAKAECNARHRVAYLVLVSAIHTVLLISDGVLVTLVDSHSHRTAGALIATTSVPEVDKLCSMYWKLLVKAIRGRPGPAELSLVYFPNEENAQ